MAFTHWKSYFEMNQTHLDHINWNELDQLRTEEKRTIEASIKQFQKGENSEGKHLIHYAKEYGDLTYLETIKLFIKEEQRHALVLGKYMTKYKIDKIQSHWIDSIFRKLRTLASLENSVMVLITAEIIAAGYYKALLKATSSNVLRNICKQILLDEEMHLNFQSYTLSIFYKQKSKAHQKLVRMTHLMLMIGTILIVWMSHRRVLKAGGYGLRSFANDVLSEFRRCDRMVKGLLPINNRFLMRATG